MTPQRQFLETTLLPRFGASFAPDAVVLNIGAGRHTYRDHFPCPIRTADVSADVGCDQQYPAEAIPYEEESADGILCNGVFERLNDPMQAMREFHRVLKKGGSLLLGVAGIDFEWHADRDRWRLTPGGAAFVTRGFRIVEEHAFERVYFYYVLGKA